MSAMLLLFLCVRLVMKTDDDAFVNMFSLIPRLDEAAVTNITGRTASSSPPTSNMLLLCNVWRKEQVAERF